MQYYSEKRLGKRMALSAFVMCTVLQVVCTVAEYLYLYLPEGNGVNDFVTTVLYFTLEIFRTASVFSSFAIIAYIIFLYGLDGGLEWFICETVGTVLLVLVVFTFKDYAFGMISLAICTVVLGAILYFRLRKRRGVYLVLMTAMIVPFINGMTTLYAVPNSYPSEVDLFSSIIYFLVDRCTVLLFLTLAATISIGMKNRAVRLGGGEASIGICGRLLPGDNPLLRAVLWIDISFFAYAMFNSFMTVVTADIMPSTVGEWTESIITYFGVPCVYLVLGYLIMWLTALWFENIFIKTEEEDEAMVRQRKTSLRQKAFKE